MSLLKSAVFIFLFNFGNIIEKMNKIFFILNKSTNLLKIFQKKVSAQYVYIVIPAKGAVAK